MSTALRLPLDSLPTMPVLGRPPDACEFLERLLSSVGDEAAFVAALETLADWYGAGLMALHEYDHRTNTGRLIPVRGFGIPLMRAYVEHYSACNVWHLQAGHKIKGGDLAVSHLMYPDSLLVHTEWYTDFVRPQGVFHSMGAVLDCRDRRTVTTPILREESAGNFTEDEQLVLRSLAPFLEQAFRLHTRLTAAEADGSALRSLLDSLPNAVFLLDAEGRVVGANLAARDLAAEADGVAVVGGHLAVDSRPRLATLSLLLRGFASDGLNPALRPGTVFRIERPSGRQAYVAELVPLAQLPSAATHPHAEAALIVSDPDDASPCNPELLQRLFGLSQAESRLASLLVAGHDLADAVAQMSITLATGKTHLQHVFSKTGVNRQADLIRLVLKSTGALRGTSTRQGEMSTHATPVTHHH